MRSIVGCYSLVVLVSLWLWIPTHALTYLAKTSETFKLAELQYEEAKLQGHLHHYKVSRVLLDRSTGSTLLSLEDVPVIDGFADDPCFLASSLKRCDWILEVVQQAESAQELIDKLRLMPADSIDDQWVLDYIRLEDASMEKFGNAAQDYSMKTLLCSVSNALTSVPALHSKTAKETIILVDTRTKDGSTLFLGKRRYSAEGKSSSIFKQWAQRPFQYSSAMNIQVAEVVVDLLCDMASVENGALSPPRQSMLLDPTCGSGTFLAFAMDHGLCVEGYDANRACSEGTRHNLEHIFGPDEVRARAKIQHHDSSTMVRQDDDVSKTPSCVVANLPWGINSIEYVEENSRILQSTRARLPATGGIPCAFVTREADPQLFEESGFEVLAQAHVPPQDFLLPKSKKKKKTTEKSEKREVGRSSCVITIARSK